MSSLYGTFVTLKSWPEGLVLAQGRVRIVLSDARSQEVGTVSLPFHVCS